MSAKAVRENDVVATVTSRGWRRFAPPRVIVFGSWLLTLTPMSELRLTVVATANQESRVLQIDADRQLPLTVVFQQQREAAGN